MAATTRSDHNARKHSYAREPRTKCAPGLDTQCREREMARESAVDPLDEDSLDAVLRDCPL